LFSRLADGSNPSAEEFKSPWTHFDGYGYNNNIPTFLRFHGKIQNIFLCKRDMIQILQEIWDAKKSFDQYTANLAIIHSESNKDDLSMLSSVINEEEGVVVNMSTSNPENTGSDTDRKQIADDKTADNVSNNDNPSPVGANGEEDYLSPLNQMRNLSSRQRDDLIDNALTANQEILNSGILSQSFIESVPSNPTMATFLDYFLQV
jgi:hypothetical protein